MMKKLLLLIVLALISTFSAIACSCSKLKKLTKADLMEERIAISNLVIDGTFSRTIIKADTGQAFAAEVLN